MMINSELIFKAMADPTRHRILQVLSLHELSVNELVEVLHQPQSTISRHLKVLREAGLLIDRHLGATSMYFTRLPARQLVNNESDSKNGTSKMLGVNGRNSDLKDWLLDWVASEPLEDMTSRRLNHVIHRRQSSDTDFFESIGSRWDQLRTDAFGHSFHLEALAALLPREWTVADVGCGTGYLLPVLSRQFKRVIAVDPVSKMLEAARNRPELAASKNVDFRVGSLSDLPIEAGEVDLVVASLVLHHVAEPTEALTEINRSVVKDGKIMIIEQQTHDNQTFRDRMGDQWWGFSDKQLTQWVKRSGFKEIRTSPLPCGQPANRDLGSIPGLFVLTATKDRNKEQNYSSTSRADEIGNEMELDVHLL